MGILFSFLFLWFVFLSMVVVMMMRRFSYIYEI